MDYCCNGLHPENGRTRKLIFCNGCLYLEMLLLQRSDFILLGKLKSNILQIKSTPIFQPRDCLEDRISRVFGSKNELFQIDILYYDAN